MMLFVAVVKLSGLFEYLAIKCARLAKGNPWLVMVLFVCLTAVLSALLDNVTTVLLIGPMTVTVCRLLDLDPLPFFLAEIMASNIGGTATLIGDPPARPRASRSRTLSWSTRRRRSSASS